MNNQPTTVDLPLEHCREYDAAAEWCAQRGLKGNFGDPLPANMASDGALKYIQADPEAFQSRVRDFAYGLAMEKSQCAIRAFTQVQAGYRSRKIGDVEYLAGRKAYEAAMAEYDLAFGELIHENARIEKLLDAAFGQLAHDCDPEDKGSIHQRKSLKTKFQKILQLEQWK